ncbi:hypothetical protein, partial [Streptomyces chryseus]|uniref:hypothetical protein n=1 Tax=Streptomyces chryseus TaxID=68186 RepID=UPI001B8810E5
AGAGTGESVTVGGTCCAVHVNPPRWACIEESRAAVTTRVTVARNRKNEPVIKKAEMKPVERFEFLCAGSFEVAAVRTEESADGAGRRESWPTAQESAAR